jgi:hypothetical protein
VVMTCASVAALHRLGYPECYWGCRQACLQRHHRQAAEKVEFALGRRNPSYVEFDLAPL